MLFSLIRRTTNNMTEPFWTKYIPSSSHSYCNNWHHRSSSNSPPSSPESDSGNEDWQAYVPPFARKYIPNTESYGSHYSDNTETSSTHYGPMNCKGDLTRSIDVIGPVSVDGNINCKNVSVMGMLSVGGGVKVEALKYVGFANIAQNIEATTFSGVGRLVTNVLSGQNITFKCDSESKSEVQDVYGQHSVKIEAKPGTPGFEVASRIISEGNVVLENTRAKEVRAKNVVLSKGSAVEIVYYSGSINVSPDSQVQFKQHASL